MPGSAFITRVTLKNYKSIASCDVRLGPLTFLVGPNGAGKSNFLDALRFISDGLNTSLEQAISGRAGVLSILRKTAAIGGTIDFRFEFALDTEKSGVYSLSIEPRDFGGFYVASEHCEVHSGASSNWFSTTSGVVTSNQGVVPASSVDKLYLVNASGLQPFEPVYRALSGIVVYNPVPDELRAFQPGTSQRMLDRKASNLGETILRLRRDNPADFARILEYLGKITPEILSILPVNFQQQHGIFFECARTGGGKEVFLPLNMSDGTLRALAILTALFQSSDRPGISLIGLEEPETGLHPAAAGVLFDSLMEASLSRQILVTSHSADLLDRNDIPEDSLLAVVQEGGQTRIGPVDRASKQAIRNRLYTPGELLRMDQLRPEA
ncbi:MAG: AAA family ATPase [Acidobacteria bacterium]|nr:AAA family ATPase [Acidobacteriota bacterium]